MWLFFDPMFYVFTSPALLLMLWAQVKVKSSFAHGMRVPSNLSGAAAARYILDQTGCHDVGVEETHGQLSDHYDPRAHVLRLSQDVYHTRSAAAVGIAAHEAGHALQHARHYMPLVVRNAAVPAARFGPITFFILVIIGMLMSSDALIHLGLIAFGGVLCFELINLPVEFDASNRAKRILNEYNIVDQEGAVAVGNVLNAAAWTYVAATLQTLLTLLYYIWVLLGSNRD